MDIWGSKPTLDKNILNYKVTTYGSSRVDSVRILGHLKIQKKKIKIRDLRLIFSPLNDLGLKSYQLQSYISYWKLEISCRDPRSFEKNKKTLIT